ncbi:sugar-transfer associated ATP-grasp domain-containing protein [Maribacter sp. LLG6340-A2]|uniref:sugar-transfer associated ATP-grasp domain-containing protein n=1 Tax=Maribacter sp. LLG6340-A2 TaxID=3160834 RepID=UPI0038704124
MKGIPNLLKDSLNYVMQKRYHLIQSSLAKKALLCIEEKKGPTNAELLTRCEEYAKDVLGWGGYAPWLKVYTAFNTEFKEGWIPDNYYGAVVVPKIQGGYGKLSNLKFFTNGLFKTDCFPDLLYHINGRWLMPNGELIALRQVLKYLFKDHEKVVFKKDHSLQGLGIKIFNTSALNEDMLSSFENGVFQSYMHQHNFFDQFNSKAVATLRITTAINKLGISSLKDTYLRLGNPKDAYVIADSQIKIPINKKTGQLSELGYVHGWQPISKIESNAMLFKGLIVPHYQEAVEVCLQLHERCKYLECIGWDVTIDFEGSVKILEWNGYHNDIKFSEAVNGPCFTDLGWENLWKSG